MSKKLEVLPDLTGSLTFCGPTEPAVDALLEFGVVVIDPVVPDDEMAGVRDAVDQLYFGSLDRRIVCKIFEYFPAASVRRLAHARHSKTSQFDPNRIPERLRGAAPAIDRVRDLDADFFSDARLSAMYASRLPRLNIVDVSRSRPAQKAFIDHQDSMSVVRLGHIIQPVATRWTIRGGYAPSRKEFDYTFLAPGGSVVTTLERAGEIQKLPAVHGSDYYLPDGEVVYPDGSEIHGGDNLTDQIRHRLGVFAQEKPVRSSFRDPIARALAKATRAHGR